MPAKKQANKKEIDAGVCENCWRYRTFKHECIYFWENKSECSKFLKHQADEDRYVRRSLI